MITGNTNVNRTKITKTKMGRKQLYGHLKRQTSEISREKTWTWQMKGNVKRETESLPIEKMHYVKARIDQTQQKTDSERSEMINHIISEGRKLTQKEYKTRHDLAWKVILWELCKKFKFDHTSKWYMHNPESFLENETQHFGGF